MNMSQNKKSDKEIANDKAERIMNGVATWTSYYRSNPHRFCEEYLNINLKVFQKMLICMMNHSNYFMYLASRGQGKTFLIAVFCVVRCILYPGTKICIASGKRKQSIEVLEKITTELAPNSDNLRLEIKQTTINQSDACIEFKNGSRIKVVTASDNARGARANILVVDEFRMVDLDVINTVLRKFLSASRQPKYLNNPKYSHLTERNKEFYLSSAWFKSHWSYEKVKVYCANLIDDTKKYFICGLPYQLAIKENLLSAEQVADEMSEADFSELAWKMEMECLWFGDTDGSLFTYEDISKTRQLKKAIYPKNISKLLKNSNKILEIPSLVHNERRILSADVALLASKKQNNDAASIFINSALPTSNNKYIGNLIYTENHEGLLTNELALKIRRLFEMYHCTDIVLDVKGIGVGVYDTLVNEMYDPEIGVTYPPLSCCNNQDYADRCSDKSAPKVIWAINATEQFNSDMYLLLREGFRQNKLNLLVSEFNFDEISKELRGIDSLDSSNKLKFQMPYIHTTLLVNELINLNYESKGKTIKVFEKSGMRKDRVSSVGYNYWVQCQLEKNLKKPRQNENFSSAFLFKSPKIRK